MRFALSAVLALGTAVQNGDAFLSPTVRLKTTEIYMSQQPQDGSADGDEVNENGDQGGSRFQEMMKLAQQGGQSGAMPGGARAIENPFLTSPSPAPTQLPANPDALSVEEQARMFREMMAGNQNPASAIPPPPVRTAATDRAGRPVGRNTDADKIANTSDLYFAQLKRDSTVRTIGRIQGNNEVSEAVFEDHGIKELDGLLKSNPYLKGKKEEEMALLDNLPDEVVAPYFKEDKVEKEVLESSGVSYKKKLMEKRQKKLGGGVTDVSTPAPQSENIEPPVVASSPPPTPTPPEPEPKPDPVVSQATISPPTPEQQQPPPSSTPPVAETPRPVTVTSSNDVRHQNLRTLMGLVLKHRGGPGFGKGRLKGPDIDLFEGLVDEITNMLRDEAQHAQPSIETPPSAIVEEPPAVEPEPNPIQATEAVSQPEAAATAVSSSPESTNIDSTIACIEGAITMYNNSPPAIQESVLVTLRAALMSAIDTCNIALASQPAPPVAASPDASIEGMIVCIEGAVTMYKNSPPALKESVLITLRLALMSAVETCNVILSPTTHTSPPAAPPAAPPAQPHTQPMTPTGNASDTVSPSSTPVEKDRNTKTLEKIYQNVQSASGDGKLGLRDDLTADEASDLAEDLVAMRGILMEELEAGIPDPDEPEAGSKSTINSSQAWDDAVSNESSASSRYKQMLAKARAEKAKS